MNGHNRLFASAFRFDMPNRLIHGSVGVEAVPQLHNGVYAASREARPDGCCGTCACLVSACVFRRLEKSSRRKFPCQPAPSCTPVIAGLTGDYRAKSTQVSLVGMTEVTKQLSVFGRIGVSRTKRSASATIGNRSGTADENKKEAISGLGVSYAFTKNIEGTFEWKWLSNTKLSAPTIGVRVGF